MWTHMGLGRRPVDAWSCGHSQGTGGTREQPGTDPLWGPADTWTSDPSPQNGQMRHWGPLSKAPICGRLCGSAHSVMSDSFHGLYTVHGILQARILECP